MRYFWILLCVLPVTVFAQLRIVSPVKPHMVLQRDKEISVFGVGVPGNEIRLVFDAVSIATRVDQNGSWTVRIPPRKCNNDPQDLHVYSGNEHLIIPDLLIGDLWVCIGQSNMEWPMQKEMHYNEWKGYSNRLMRFYNPTYAGKNIFNAPFSDSVIQRLTPERFYEGEWTPCDPSSLAGMSAVAFYFGRMIADSLHIPVGLINLSIGGAPLETFVPMGILYGHAQFAAKVKGNWLQNDALPVWIRERGQQNVGALKNPPSDDNGPFHGFKPGFAYTAGIRPLTRIPIAGIINYQGESNAQEMERVLEYNQLSALMLRRFRTEWNDPVLPYYYVQLSSIDTINYKGQLWSEFRNQQRLFLQMDKHTGMAISADAGARNDVHPRNKKIVGERLANVALHAGAGVAQGPLPLKARYRKGELTISFINSPGGLRTSDGQSVRGFSLPDGIAIEAQIDSNKIKLHVPFKPDYIYYGWKSFSDGNLINTEGFPASTFKIRVQ